MKRCAIFVEGFTEQEFVDRLLRTIVTEKEMQIEKIDLNGKKGSRHGSRIQITARHEEQRYFFAIYDCGGGGDDTVKSDIVDRYEGLCQAGYTSIIGIRDVLGRFTAADIPKLRAALRFGLKTRPLETVMVLVIMETEAWFIAEYSHMTRIHPGLDFAAIVAAIGFDPEANPAQVESIARPADELHRIYQLVGEAYSKQRAIILRTIMALNFEHIYLELGNRVPAMVPLMAEINKFLA